MTPSPNIHFSPVVDLARQLLRMQSVTPEDGGCQSTLIDRLSRMGFTIERLPFAEVSNFWARLGTDDPLFAFAGHTDVVPTGPLQEWRHPPFSATVEDGLLHGRGSADMKGSLAAMIVACEKFLASNKPRGSIAFLVTSDEEGPAINGTRQVVEKLEARQEKITWCLVGEPSCQAQFGDTLKNGRRGSLSGDLTIFGKQGHIAYPHLSVNPIHQSATLIEQLSGHSWDQGNEFFPPTSFQVSNISGGTGAGNVIPGELELLFNFRFSPETTAAQLQHTFEIYCKDLLLDYYLHWTLFGQPFQTEIKDLVVAAQEAIRKHCRVEPVLSTTGGTSDGRFIAPTGAEVIEFGPRNGTIHRVNECVAIDDLERLVDVYEDILKRLLA